MSLCKKRIDKWTFKHSSQGLQEGQVPCKAEKMKAEQTPALLKELGSRAQGVCRGETNYL